LGTAAEIGKDYLNVVPPAAPVRTNLPSPGGVTLGPVNIARRNGGQIIFVSGSEREQSLILVYPIFGVTDDS
jgi:hypothetical protein